MFFRLSVVLLLAFVPACAENGSLLLAGGGKPGPEIVKRFAGLAGGLDAPIVVIPTAGGQDRYDGGCWKRPFCARRALRI